MSKENLPPMMMSDGISQDPRKFEIMPSSFDRASINCIENDEEIVRVCDMVSYHLDRYPNINLSLKQLLSLKLFNRYALSAGTESANVEDIISEIDLLASVEKDLANPKNPLPTIGVELEAPITQEVMRLRDVLSRFDIKHNDEYEVLYEASPSFSYSPKIQAMILQELAKIGFVPMGATLDPKYHHNSDNLSGYKIDHEVPLSLHINLGLSCFSKYSQPDGYYKDMEILSDSLTLAYTSPERIKNKKRKIAFDHNKPAVTSEKIAKLSSHILPIRLELKAAEFRDASSYRALYDAQYLGAALNSFIAKNISPSESISVDSELPQIYEDFMEEANILFEKYQHNLGQTFESDKERQKTAFLMKSSDIQASFKHLLSKYRRLIADAIKQEAIE